MSLFQKLNLILKLCSKIEKQFQDNGQYIIYSHCTLFYKISGESIILSCGILVQTKPYFKIIGFCQLNLQWRKSMDFQIHLRLFELNSSGASIPEFKKNTLALGNIREFFRQRQFRLLQKKPDAIYNSSDLTLRLYNIHEPQDCK